MKNFDQCLENDNYKEEPVDVSTVDIAAAYPKMLEDFVHLNSVIYNILNLCIEHERDLDMLDKIVTKTGLSANFVMQVIHFHHKIYNIPLHRNITLIRVRGEDTFSAVFEVLVNGYRCQPNQEQLDKGILSRTVSLDEVIDRFYEKYQA